MKEYARRFYNGKQWRQTQAAYMSAHNYICERCGQPAKIVHHKKYITPFNISDPSITLDWNNLECLCQDCHNAEHMTTPATAAGLVFDQSGALVKRG